MFIQIFDIVNCYSNSKNKPFLYINSSLTLISSGTFGGTSSTVTVTVPSGYEKYIICFAYVYGGSTVPDARIVTGCGAQYLGAIDNQCMYELSSSGTCSLVGYGGIFAQSYILYGMQ